MLSVRQSLYSSQFISECGLTFSEDVNPQTKVENLLGINQGDAKILVEILLDIIMKHDKVGKWKPKVKEYGTPTYNSKKIDSPPIAILGVEFHSLQPNTTAFLLKQHSIFEGVVPKEEWNKFSNLRTEIATVLIGWELTSISTWASMITRKYQLSSEKNICMRPRE